MKNILSRRSIITALTVLPAAGAATSLIGAETPMTPIERIKHHKKELYAAIREQAKEYEASGFVVLGGNAVLGNDPLWGGGFRVSFNKAIMEPHGNSEISVERQVAAFDL